MSESASSVQRMDDPYRHAGQMRREGTPVDDSIGATTSTAHDMDMTRRLHHPDTVRTVSGRYVNVFEPDPDTIAIEDIAHGLSMICRYGGHTKAHYSVGEHSLNVCAQLQRMYDEPLLSLAGLLHDASEAYVGDMVRPLKHNPAMGTYRAVEHTLEQVIHAKFGTLDIWTDPRIKQIDNEILPWEMAMVRDSRVRVAPVLADVADQFEVEFDRLRYEITRAS